MKKYLLSLFAMLAVVLGAQADDVTDVLDNAWTGVSGTSYKAVTDLDGSASEAVYSVQCAGGNSAIQLRSNNNNSGIVTTTSGGDAKTLKVTWNENTTAARTLSVYGKTTAYSAPSDLYDTSKQGTLIGELTILDAESGVSTLDLGSEYQYIGIRSKSGAVYLDKVELTWTTGGGPVVAKPTFDPASTSFVGEMEVKINSSVEGGTIYYTTDGATPTEEDAIYAGPFTVTETTTVKAVVVTDAGVSAIAEATYTRLEKSDIIEVNSAAVGTFLVEGTVTAAGAGGFIVDDGTDYIFVYYAAGDNTITAGKVVRVLGTTTEYKGVKQFTSAAEVTDLGEETLVYPDPGVLDGTDFEIFKSDAAISHGYYAFTGDLTISGNYYNIAVEGADEAIGSIIKPLDDISELSGKTVDIEGYGLYVNSKYIYFIATKIEEHVEKFNISMADGVEGGSLEIEPATAAADETVTVTVIPDEGKVLESITANCVNINQAVELNEGETPEIYTFLMPADDVVINPVFADAPASDLYAQAKELAADADAVAVGKLLAAIEDYEFEFDETALQAAVDQFVEDNKDVEKDETAKVATNGWKNFNGGNAGVCATQFAPAITTYDGRTANLAEVFEGNGDRTGTIIYQDITGLENGTYKVGFYGNAFSTSGRDGFACTMADGAEDVAYVFANDEREFIVAHIATSTTENNFRQFDVEVTDGTIRLGMGKAEGKTQSTNWHTMQIYQLTWFATAKEVYAADQTELAALLDKAAALDADGNKTNGKEALESAIAEGQGAMGSNMLNIPELEAIIANLKQAITDFTEANYFIDFTAGEYYIIDAETDLKMAAGNAWGTHGIVNEEGLDLILTPNTETRRITIDSRVSNGGDNHYLGSNLYMDSPAADWALDYQGFGFFITNGTQYLNYDENYNLILSDTPREWIIVTKEGVMAERMEELAEASEENPVDASFLIQDGNFNRNDLRREAWVVENCTNSNLGDGCTETNGNGCAESYQSTFTISQLVQGAPAGKYVFTAQGFYTPENAENAPVFLINEKTVTFPVQTGSENSMATASASFVAGSYYIDPVEIIVGEDGEITVGVQGTQTDQWVIWDNFQLTYYGPAEETKYEIHLPDLAGATITTDPEGEAAAGETVTITVETDEGFDIDAVQVLDVTGAPVAEVEVAETIGMYTFTMPAQDVTIDVTLVEVDPNDYTYLIENPAYLHEGDAGTADYAGWTWSPAPGESGWKYRDLDEPMNLVTYSGNVNFSFEQTIPEVPAGQYRLSVYGFYRAGSAQEEANRVTNGDVTHNLNMFAEVGDAIFTQPIMNLYEGAAEEDVTGKGNHCVVPGYESLFVPDGANDSRDFYIAGYYRNDLIINITEAGEVKIGINHPTGMTYNNDYAPIGAWELYKVGDIYNVNVSADIANGTVTATPAAAIEGTSITLAAEPAEGFYLESLNVVGSISGDPIELAEDFTFTMPAEDVKVTAEFLEIPSEFTYTYEGAEDGQYEGAPVTIDIDLILAAIGATDGNWTIYSETPDGRVEGVRGSTDGWRNEAGVFTGWSGDGASGCVYYVQDSEASNTLLVGRHPSMVGKAGEYTATLIYVNNATEAEVAVNIVLVYPGAEEQPEVVTVGQTYTTDAVAYDYSEGSYTEKTTALSADQISAICDELGIESLDDAYVYGYNPTTEEFLPIVDTYGFDGWRDANGDFHAWTGNKEAPICAKYDDGTTFYCYNISGCPDAEINAYWAYGNEKGYAVLIEIPFVLSGAPEPPALTYDDLNIIDEQGIEFNYDLGTSYQEDAATVDMAAIKAAFGTPAEPTLTIYAVASDNTLDPSYGVGTSDGWRNADGDWESWGGESVFCVKADFEAETDQIYWVGTKWAASQEEEEPGTYVARYVFVNEDGSEKPDAVLFTVTINYGNADSIEGIFADQNGEQKIFDLSGRRIKSITKGGMYIINGKKVLVK